MKKILVLVACMLLLVGCSDATAKITNGSETVVTVGDQSYTREELYNFMTNYGGSYYAIVNAQKTILDTEVPVTDEMISSVDSTLELYSQMMGSYFETYLQSQGFAGSEQYREVLIQNEQLNELYKKYVEANYDSLSSTFAPKKIQLMKFGTEEEANTALQAVKDGNDFATVAQENKSTVDGAAQLVTSTSSFETVVQYAINTQAVGELSEVIGNDDKTAYYVLKVLSTDAAELKEEAIPVIATAETIADQSIQYYFKEYNFTVYDINLYNQLQQSYSDLLNQ